MIQELHQWHEDNEQLVFDIPAIAATKIYLEGWQGQQVGALVLQNDVPDYTNSAF